MDDGCVANSVVAVAVWSCHDDGRHVFRTSVASNTARCHVPMPLVGALILLIGGIAVLWASARFRTRILLLALMLIGPVYVGLRVPNLWSGQELVQFFATQFSKERAHSLEYRFMCENLLIVKAIEQPVFGWGGWGRSDVYFETR